MSRIVSRREALAAMAVGVAAPSFADSPGDVLTIIVMDPLSAPLSCPCVKGYAQRDYEKLADVLSKDLGRPVKTYFSESLTDALKKKTNGKADVIIGKESVVRAETKANGIVASPIASLTGKDGKTTMTGLFVVATADRAFVPSDLKEHKIIFGAESCDEKHLAAMNVLRDAGVSPPAKPECCPACSDGAVAVIEGFKEGKKVATVISSYAQPLLEGCGTIKKGDLRVVGETAPVPFVVAYVNAKVPAETCKSIAKTLLNVGKDAELAKALESKQGFVAFSDGKKK